MTRQDELVDRKAAAEYCNVTERTIRHWQTTGRLPVIKLSRRVQRYERSALERLIQQGKES